MAVASVQSMASLSTDIVHDILRRLDGPTLATAACTCASLSEASKEEKLWENASCAMWPSTNRTDVKSLISEIGGFRKFYADCFPLIVNKELTEYLYDGYVDYLEYWTEAEYYGGVDDWESGFSPSDFVSLVDVSYKDKNICSKVLWGIPNAIGFDGWFYACPFRIDVLTADDNEEEVTISASDGLNPIISLEQERKDGKLWQDLREGLRLSWIVVNRKIKQAANLASWSPLGGRRHFPTERDFSIRFGSVLPAKLIVPCQVVECVIVMKFRVVHTENENARTTLRLTELSMRVEDMEGAHVNGRNSLQILEGALSCRRSKNYGEVIESCHLYSKVQNELKHERIRNENLVDRLCILAGIAAFMSFCYYVL